MPKGFVSEVPGFLSFESSKPSSSYQPKPRAPSSKNELLRSERGSKRLKSTDESKPLRAVSEKKVQKQPNAIGSRKSAFTIESTLSSKGADTSKSKPQKVERRTSMTAPKTTKPTSTKKDSQTALKSVSKSKYPVDSTKPATTIKNDSTSKPINSKSSNQKITPSKSGKPTAGQLSTNPTKTPVQPLKTLNPSIARRQNPAVLIQKQNSSENASGSSSRREQAQDSSSSQSESYDYSDDFEDYESDFEPYVDSDEERNKNDKSQKTDTKHSAGDEAYLDSGTYDMSGTHLLKDQMQSIQKIEEEENLTLDFITKDFSSLASKDEGFEDFKREETSLSDFHSHQFITFETISREEQKSKKLRKSQLRAKKLLSMFRLDAVGGILMNLPTIPYEVYMQCYGRSNTLQVSTQTNEDRPTGETQTEEIQVRTKWTQIPGAIQNNTNDITGLNKLPSLSEERQGVGDDSEKTVEELEDADQNWRKALKMDSIRLDKFLLEAGKRMVMLLEKKSYNAGNGNAIVQENSQDLRFSTGHIPLQINNIKFLQNRPVNFVFLEPIKCIQCLTVHSPSSLLDSDVCPQSTILCVWNTREPSRPTKLLVTSINITCGGFNWPYPHIIQAGLKDGSIAVWDTTEQAGYHQRATLEKKDWVFRSPSYITASITEGVNHLSPIVSLESIKGDTLPTNRGPQFSPTQVCSLDESGLLIIWTLVQTSRPSTFTDLGQAHWSKAKLVKSRTLYAFENLMPSSALVYSATSLMLHNNYAFVTTNTDQIIRKVLTNGTCLKSLYKSTSGKCLAGNCLQICPFEENYFLVGCDNGEIRLYSQLQDTPLLSFSGSGEPQGSNIKSILWSTLKPGVFYVLDNNSSIHVWDLCQSDMYPLFSASFSEETISSISLAAFDFQTSYLACSTLKGEVKLHQLTKELTSFDKEKCEKDLEKFICYINILL